MFALFSALKTRRPAPTEVSTKMNISDERVQEIKSILRTVGLPEDDYGIASAIQNKSSYEHGELEWTERHEGIRYVFWGSPFTGVIYTIDVVKHGYTRFTDEEIVAANLKLSAVLA